MSFWSKFGFQTTSAIDTILAREQFTLEDLLDEEDLLTECRAQNKKLIDYLATPTVLSQLVDYVTVAPDSDEERLRYKYPYLACELLCLDIYDISEAFVATPSLAGQLLGFFAQPPPADALLCSYTTRVCASLLQRQYHEFYDALRQQPNAVRSMFAHFDSPLVLDLLLRLLASEEPDQSATVQDWLLASDLAAIVADALQPHHSSDMHENVASLLLAVVDQTPIDRHSPILDALTTTTPLLNSLVAALTSPSPSLFVHCCAVVTRLIERHSREETVLDTDTPLDRHSDLVRATVSSVDALAQRLKPAASAPTNDDNQHTDGLRLSDGRLVALPLSNGERIAPVGHERLKIIDLLSALVRLRSAAVDDCIVASDILASAFDLFFAYPWNNFLHSSVRNLVSDIFCGVNTKIKLAIFQKYALLDRLADAAIANQTLAQSVDPHSIALGRGFMGFIIQLSNGINQSCVSDAELSELLGSHEKWMDFSSDLLETLNRIEATEIGEQGMNHRDASDVSDDNEQDMYTGGSNTELISVFKQLLSTHQFNGEYPPSFGEVNDDDDDDSSSSNSDSDNSAGNGSADDSTDDTFALGLSARPQVPAALQEDDDDEDSEGDHHYASSASNDGAFDLRAWLQSVDASLVQFEQQFLANGISQLRDVKNLTEEDLEQDIGIASVPQRRRILLAISELP